MKLLLAVVLCMTLAMVAITAHAETEQAKTRLVSEWEIGLEAAEKLYGNMLWALDYIDAWTQSTNWDDLACARTACILISGYLNEAEYPSLTLTNEEKIELAKAGVTTDILMDYSLPVGTQQEMYDYFRRHLLPRLDTEACWQYELESVKDLAGAIRLYLRMDCDYLRLATNYLYLPLYDHAEAEERWSVLQARYPIIFPAEFAWMDDAASMEKLNDDLLVDTDIPAELNGALIRCVERDKRALEYLIEGAMAPMLDIANQPDVLPIPLWYDTELAGFAPFRYNDDKTMTFPKCGDMLTVEDCNIYLQQTDVSLEQTEGYMDMIRSYVKAMSRTENAWTVLMEDYTVSVSWENQAVVMFFLGESSTLSYKFD